MSTASAAGRPVYVIGAGFSKAISSAMPTTDELGQRLRERLAGEVTVHRRKGQSFEDWLTTQVTPLPFLSGYENSQRAADAARVLAEIAGILDEKVEAASNQPAPLWLRQLIALWHAEQAVLLSFNYDTLIERAVNAAPLVLADGDRSLIRGDHITFPAPAAPQPQTRGDRDRDHVAGSFQLIKLHGSLSWYSADSPGSGSTLVRRRLRGGLGQTPRRGEDIDFYGTTTLDRFLIPPVTTKDGYYRSYLGSELWRSARTLLASASAITFLGYSLPAEDRVTGDLIARTPDELTIEVVDREPEEVVQRVHDLGVAGISEVSGDDAISAYVSARIESAAGDLIGDPMVVGLDVQDATVLVSITARDLERSRLCALWRSGSGEWETLDLDPAEYDNTSRTLTELLRERLVGAELLTVERLRAALEDHGRVTFFDRWTYGRLVAIGASSAWGQVHLDWAPLDSADRAQR